MNPDKRDFRERPGAATNRNEGIRVGHEDVPRVVESRGQHDVAVGVGRAAQVPRNERDGVPVAIRWRLARAPARRLHHAAEASGQDAIPRALNAMPIS